ncbi:TIGR01212 family radical SAM protein [Helicobacter cetorum]|uniref:TIGR01212 family radical SAM protein n=1 Tax=Helicobacter cetorum TaxID=138563 RepID=UPI000CF08C46|nr:TIGR01212 family radical SAM protein [Helicobacter cetorum]
MRKVLTIGRYFKSIYKERVRKVPISLIGFTCPNIDGSVAKGGCIYCKNESFSPNLVRYNDLKNAPLSMNFKIQENPLLSKQLAQIKEQFYDYANKYQEKYKVRKFLIYFQSYTNTYAPLNTLKALYEKALSFEGVVGLSIGTRTDCIQKELLDYLEQLAKNKEIWLEFGVQSVFDETLKRTNRGHLSGGIKELFEEVRKRGIKVCAHLIYGLPKENEEMMLHSLKSVLEWGIDGIKIHPLYVVKDTALEKMHQRGHYTPISLEAYAKLIAKSLKIIPPEVVVQRVSAGICDETLIAPKWCLDKNVQMRYLRDCLREVKIQY